MKKYRLVKVTYASGYVQWNIEWRFLWVFWLFLDGYFDEAKAKRTFATLCSGTPYTSSETVEIPPETDELPF